LSISQSSVDFGEAAFDKERLMKIKVKGIDMRTAILFVFAVILFFGCSSLPRGQPETRTRRRAALSQLEAANKEADRGSYANALSLADEGRRFAVAADDPALLIRSALTRGVILAWLGRAGEARASFEGALAEAERIRSAELAAASRLHIARQELLEGSRGAAEVRDQVKQEIALIKTEQTDLALGWIVVGLAEKELNNWADAEKGIKNALDIHVKSGSPEQAAYDWYLIASIRSVSGAYQGALDALDEAIGYDRRAENSYGLGMDWKAVGDVYKKEGKNVAADIAYRRAADIFRSNNMEKEAAEAEAKALSAPTEP
jgi:tetratricopeptide (TPR) repeat protein